MLEVHWFSFGSFGEYREQAMMAVWELPFGVNREICSDPGLPMVAESTIDGGHFELR
jgi:hypothetical protein